MLQTDSHKSIFHDNSVSCGQNENIKIYKKSSFFLRFLTCKPSNDSRKQKEKCKIIKHTQTLPRLFFYYKSTDQAESVC